MDTEAKTDPAAAMGATVAQSVHDGGRYELGPLIGRGGSGEVYRGLDRSLHRPVAIKVLHGHQTFAGQAARFDREARLLAALQHPHVIPLLDAGRDGERRYLVMPLIEGSTLAERIAAGPIPGPQVERVGAALADALAHIHAHGIAHRDVKPSNVLLGNAGQVLLTDFGIARDSACDSTATMSGLVTGTVAYIAPEQLEGGESGFACDVYALGLVLLESLTGVRVFEGRGTLLEQALARLWRLPVIPVSLGPGWRDLIGAMTARDPALRPAARAVANRLTGGLSTAAPVTVTEPSPDPATQAPPGAVPRAHPRGRRRWTAPAVGTLCACAVTAVALTIMAASPTPARATATPPTAHTTQRPTATASTPALAISTQPVALTPVDNSVPLNSSAAARHDGQGNPREHQPRAGRHKGH
jgi:serine/threonine protein kinase